MAKKLQISIAEPCHENWDAMTPVEMGKFCGSCQKQVIDFSNMSDRQIAEFFKKPSTGSACGRFMADQLDRPIEIPRKRIPWLKYFFQIAIPAFLFSLKASAKRTQGEIRIQSAQSDTTVKPIRVRMGMVAKPKLPAITKDTILTPVLDTKLFPVREPKRLSTDTFWTNMMVGGLGIQMIDTPMFTFDKKKFYGKVVDQEGKPIPFASIETNKKGAGVAADENGFFSIRRSSIDKKDSLFVSAAGFETKTIPVDKHANTGLTIELRANIVLPEVILPGYMGMVRGRINRYYVLDKKADCSVKIDSVKNEMINHPTTANQLFVYPNPVASGSSININLKNAEEGYYQLQVLSQSGQLVRQQEIWIDAKAVLMNTPIPLVAAGSYMILLVNKKTGKKYSEMIIIQ
jgi:hypothetical protein